MTHGRDVEPDRVPDHKRRRRGGRIDRGSRGPSLRSAAAVGILLIWAASTVYDITSAAYDPPEGLNTIALAAATYLFGSAFIQENKERNDR
jgi:hypothetical protein